MSTLSRANEWLVSRGLSKLRKRGTKEKGRMATTVGPVDAMQNGYQCLVHIEAARRGSTNSAISAEKADAEVDYPVTLTFTRATGTRRKAVEEQHQLFCSWQKEKGYNTDGHFERRHRTSSPLRPCALKGVKGEPAVDPETAHLMPPPKRQKVEEGVVCSRSTRLGGWGGAEVASCVDGDELPQANAASSSIAARTEAIRRMTASFAITG